MWDHLKARLYQAQSRRLTELEAVIRVVLATTATGLCNAHHVDTLQRRRHRGAAVGGHWKCIRAARGAVSVIAPVLDQVHTLLIAVPIMAM